MTIFLVISRVSLVAVAASQRNLSLTANSTSIGGAEYYYLWDDRFKTEENCSRFRSPDTPTLFFVWPEADFRYCCSSFKTTNVTAHEYSLTDYVYHQHGYILRVGIYFDLIIADMCLPYWKCWHSEATDPQRLQAILTFRIQCELGDLKQLYTDRFWRLVVVKYGVLMSALPLIVLLEVGVLLATLVLHPLGFATSAWREIFTLWWQTLLPVKFRMWLHLTLLTVVGNCFIEGIGHSYVYSWEAFIMDNFSFVYLMLPIALAIAAFEQQLVDWRVMDLCIQRAQLENSNRIDHVERWGLRTEYKDEDWKWQPIFMQITTLLLLECYVRHAAEEGRLEFVSLLVGVAAIASTWSFIVAFVTFIRKLDLLMKSFRRS